MVAAKSNHWGLQPIVRSKSSDSKSKNNEDAAIQENIIKNKEDAVVTEDISESQDTVQLRCITLERVLQNLGNIAYGIIDCTLCGLPLKNEVLLKDGGLSVFKCGHVFHGACLDLNKIKLCPSCSLINK